ncbi:uncharacterized protein LOC143894753 [Temnothorax americanus]|uniref:uncharacterized protein LOC143894753 n=1 Tax=Temnothorax americanus TaxID=1964332 RepID=UPI0040697121
MTQIKKIFSAHIINKNVTMNKNKKINKNIKSSNRKELEDKVKNSQHIMRKEKHPSCTYVPKRNTSPHTMQIYNSKPRLQNNTPNSSIHNQQIRNAEDNIASQADYSSHTYPNNEFISKINIPMEVSSMAYNSCATTYNAQTQNSLFNSDKDSNTPSSIIYSAASRTLLNYQNVPLNDQQCTNASSFSGLFPWTVRKRDMEVVERLLTMMKTAYREQTKMNILGTPEKSAICSIYFADDDNKEELSPNCGFYILKSKKAYIKLKYDMHHDWKVLVRETLLEVYGLSIANYSATGKRGTRQPINRQLFNGLFASLESARKSAVNFK